MSIGGAPETEGVLGKVAMVLLTVVAPWLALLCWFDCRERRLPNWLTLGGAAVALAWRLGYGGPESFIEGFAAAAIAGGFLFIPFLLRGAGGGDVKMIFAAGAVAGWRQVLPLLFYTSLAGVVVVIVMLLSKQLDPSRLKHYGRCLVDWRYDRAAGREKLPAADSQQVRVPFSLAIAAGMVAALILTLF